MHQHPVPTLIACKAEKQDLLLPKAIEAIAKEWSRLPEINTWEEDRVAEYQPVVDRIAAENAKGLKKAVHVARIWTLCHMKNPSSAEADE